MAKDVHNIVLKVVREKGNMSEQEAIIYVKKMESQRRYSSDVWSWNVYKFIFLARLRLFCHWISKIYFGEL